MVDALAFAAVPFAALDALLAAGLPAAARLAVWGAGTGTVSMLAYRAASPQRALARTRRAAATARRRLARHDGDAATLGRLMRRSLGLSLRHLRLALAPTALAGLPVLAVAAWIGHAYAAPGGPGASWLDHWALPFFGTLAAVSLALKAVLRIA